MKRSIAVLGLRRVGIIAAVRKIPGAMSVARSSYSVRRTDRMTLLNKILKYDNGDFDISSRKSSDEIVELEMPVVEALIVDLRSKMEANGDAADLFGKRKNDAIEGIVRGISMEFGGEKLYPTIEAQAAQLLYSVIKEDPFLHENMYIAVCLFIRFLEINKYLVDEAGDCVLDNGHLLFVVILIAESKPEEREKMIKMVVDMLVREF